GTGRSFQLEVVESPGGYICGEQSTQLQVIQGERDQPRLKNSAEDIQERGLWDCPTVLNNVETFAWIPLILLGDGGVRGGAPDVADPARRGLWFRDRGVDEHPGLRLFPICGDVQRPGVYELPIGTPLGELIARAGGLPLGRTLQAIAPSGPSGGFL